MENKNGFPFNTSQINKIQDYKGDKYFPCDNLLYKNLLKIILNNYPEIKEENLFFHGTSWTSVDSILNGIEITQRRYPSNFGSRNFYLTDNLEYAIDLTFKYTQRAVIIFYIPDEFLGGLNRLHFPLSDISSWKELIFNVRNSPKYLYRNSLTITRKETQQKTREYNKYISDLDSLDLISGPICCNPKADSKEKLEYLSHDDGTIPYQYSFKDSSYSFLNDFILLPIYFRSSF